jgi:hypothetical protein
VAILTLFDACSERAERPLSGIAWKTPPKAIGGADSEGFRVCDGAAREEGSLRCAGGASLPYTGILKCGIPPEAAPDSQGSKPDKVAFNNQLTVCKIDCCYIVPRVDSPCPNDQPMTGADSATSPCLRPMSAERSITSAA